MDSKVETLQIEISDFEGALKLQSTMIDKINTSRYDVSMLSYILDRQTLDMTNIRWTKLRYALGRF